MAETKQIVFTHREIAEALVKREGIHEGLWGIYIEFGIAGANVGTSPTTGDINPAAIVPVLKIGIQRFDTENNLTVDAAIVNPKSKSHPRPKPKQVKKKATPKAGSK